MTTEPSLVYIVDDDPAIRDALGLLLETVEIASKTFASGAELLESVEPDSRGCVLLDIRMPGIGGMETHEQLKASNCQMPVIFLTGHGDVPMAVEALQQGACNFIQKPFRDQEIIDAITSALHDDQSRHEQLAEQESTRRAHQRLTPREKQVMQHVVAGAANKVIAMDLGLSQRTVEVHRARVMEKMGARSLAELVKMSLTLDG